MNSGRHSRESTQLNCKAFADGQCDNQGLCVGYRGSVGTLRHCGDWYLLVLIFVKERFWEEGEEAEQAKMFHVLNDAAVCRCVDPVNRSCETTSAQCLCAFPGTTLTGTGVSNSSRMIKWQDIVHVEVHTSGRLPVLCQQFHGRKMGRSGSVKQT